MYFGYDEDNIVYKIEYAKKLYKQQQEIVRKEQYIERLLLEDYLRNVKNNISRYEMANILKDAQKQMHEKLKKNRPDFETLKAFMMEDFFHNDKEFKITQIMRCGYESYAWKITIIGYGKEFGIQIPIVRNITPNTFSGARYGKFCFFVKTSESMWTIICESYKIEDIAVAIKEYFELPDEREHEE